MVPAARSQTLTVVDHDRAAAGLRYVYPVVSRRAGGLSVGINLNVNNACNWRCIYCQVPGLRRGAAPEVDLPRLREELRLFLGQVLHGDFLQSRVPEGSRRLNDIALSGNGEPTSAREFEDVIEIIGETRAELNVPREVKTVLITNGSLLHRREVKSGVEKLRGQQGEVWFKIDSGSTHGMRLVNDTRSGLARVRENLAIAAHACPTWVQTCVFALDGAAPSEVEQQAYLELLEERLRARVPIRGVLLYGLARKSQQPEAERLSSLPAQWLEAYAGRIRALGLEVKVTP
ncbi:MAG TPA: radical SAM protein [Burkholderiales bacterium]|nr:radical SAM protein [Burkholderiales bacterium]